MSNNAEAVNVWDSIRPMVEALIDERTRSCIRAQRATVVTAPNADTGKIVVQLPFDKAPISLPYSSAVAEVEAGSQVWILIPHDNTLTNGVVVNDGMWRL